MKILKYLTFLILYSCTTQNTIAQENYSFNQLVTQTNSYLELYSQVSPFDEEIFAIKDFQLSKNDIKEIQAQKDSYQEISKDSMDKFEFIYFLQEKIMSNLDEITHRPSFKEADITQLLDKDELSIVISDDRKLFNFSIDEKTGGTYRSRISMIYYTELDSITQGKYSMVNHKPPNAYKVFNSDGYGAIYTIATDIGTKYVLTGGVKGCSTCYWTSILLVKIENGLFISEFHYAVESRSWETGVVYYSETKTIEVNYLTDDLTSYCNCEPIHENETELDRYDLDMDESNRLKCHCKFKFNGLNFELVKESWEKLDE